FPRRRRRGGRARSDRHPSGVVVLGTRPTSGRFGAGPWRYRLSKKSPGGGRGGGTGPPGPDCGTGPPGPGAGGPPGPGAGGPPGPSARAEGSAARGADPEGSGVVGSRIEGTGARGAGAEGAG